MVSTRLTDRLIKKGLAWIEKNKDKIKSILEN
jgi:hypothetical protein